VMGHTGTRSITLWHAKPNTAVVTIGIDPGKNSSICRPHFLLVSHEGPADLLSKFVQRDLSHVPIDLCKFEHLQGGARKHHEMHLVCASAALLSKRAAFETELRVRGSGHPT
jgi:hypothetical protein